MSDETYCGKGRGVGVWGEVKIEQETNTGDNYSS